MSAGANGGQAYQVREVAAAPDPRAGLARWLDTPDWQGETVAILGGGPSLKPWMVDRVRDNGWRCVAVNNSVYLAPWADGLYAQDRKWWRWQYADFASASALAQFKGWKATQDPRALADHPQARIRWLEAATDPRWPDTDLRRRGGFDPRPGRLRLGADGCFAATGLVLKTLPARIVLLGVDMRCGDDGRTHWHKGHVDETGRARPVHADVFWRAMLPLWDTLAKPVWALGVEVVNASPGSALTVFPKANLEDLAA